MAPLAAVKTDKVEIGRKWEKWALPMDSMMPSASCVWPSTVLSNQWSVRLWNGEAMGLVETAKVW